MAKVYLPTVPTRHDQLQNKRVPTVDLNPAAEYGTLEIVTEYDCMLNPSNCEMWRRKIYLLFVQEFKPEDCIVCVGDPVIFSLCVNAAMAVTPTVNVLKWDRKAQEYVVLKLGVE